MATLIEGFPLISTLRDAVFLTATVSEIEALTPRMRRIRFSGPRLHGLGWTPGQHVRLQVESLRQSVLRLHPYPVLRTYSIYAADPDRGALDIVMVDHDGDPKGATPARLWAMAATLGDHVRITRPQGKFVIRDDAPYHVFAGEETASVAFAAMLRSLPPPPRSTEWWRPRPKPTTCPWPGPSNRSSAAAPRPRTPPCSPTRCAAFRCRTIRASPTSPARPAPCKPCARY